ncbi:MAG: hypothetical protein IMY83_03775 [Chloroflexi bacterium]|nr:hypothetical protein [Chloroflexota bacterium]MCK4580183.1 hypothetical protein [Dehalococcoidia bacterium]
MTFKLQSREQEIHRYTYQVEAETLQEAKDLIESGEVEPVWDTGKIPETMYRVLSEGLCTRRLVPKRSPTMRREVLQIEEVK